MNDLRNAIACLFTNHEQKGTAWLATPSLMVTAWHCVKDLKIGTQVELRFDDISVSGTIEDLNQGLDVALIRVVASDHSGTPLTLVERPTRGPTTCHWRAIGFPDAPLGYDTGLVAEALDGNILDFNASVRESPRIQLTCNQGNPIGSDEEGKPEGSKLQGVSGGPVTVQLGGDDATPLAVALISQNTESSDKVLYVTPIDEVCRAFPVLQPEADIRSWDEFGQIPFVVRDDDGIFRTNLNRRLLDAIWNEGGGLRGFRTNVRTDECPWLSSAVERIIVHSPFEGTRASTDLHVAGVDSWRAKFRRCVRDWLPLVGMMENRPISKYRFVEESADRLPIGGTRFENHEEVALHIQTLCNEWVLDRLRNEMQLVFADPIYVGVPFAKDLLAEMESLWNLWLHDFQANTDLLHHFFGLVLVGNGEQSMQRTAAGVGPMTVQKCLLHASAFTLAICAALPGTMRAVRGEKPGNLGDLTANGHSCGMESLSGGTLNMEMRDRSHRWHTTFVMLPHFTDLWETEKVKQGRLDQDIDATGASLTAQPSEAIVLAGDTSLRTAMKEGLDALRKLLAQRCDESAESEQLFVQEGTHVDLNS